MKNSFSSLKIRLYIASAITFLIGSSTSIYIYMTAQDIPESVFYDFEHSKRFRHEMEVAGGKLNMLFHEMYKEFQGLWEGKTLAYTAAVITIIISICLIYIAMHLHNNNNPDIAP